jgi:predicted metal-dependent phosphoesterase TrpH
MSDAERRSIGWRTPWALPGKWFRGVTHVHTTESDGRLDPAAAIAWYREHKYSFAAITDHGTLTDTAALGDESFVTLPGIELSAGKTELDADYHVVGLGVTRAPIIDPTASAQDAIDAIREAGGEAVLAHPYWSGATFADLLPLQGHIGVEIYNATCEESISKGVSTVQWDDLLARGKRLWGLAVDDTHWRRPDSGSGWIVLRARRLEREAMMQALRDGHFYSSRGPRLTGVEVVEGVVRVTSSAAAAITFVCDNWRGRRFHAETDAGINRAEYAPPDGIRYVRVECVDRYGRVAWSNPIYWEQ